MAMKPKNSFFIKIRLKKYFEPKEPKLAKKDHFFLAKIIVKLMAPAFQKLLKFNLFIINYGRICFLKLDNAISLQQKKPFFFTISWHKTVFCHENDKPPWQTTYTIWKLGSRRFFWAWVWVSSTSNHWARIFTTLWPPNQGEHLDRLIYIYIFFKIIINVFHKENPFIAGVFCELGGPQGAPLGIVCSQKCNFIILVYITLVCNSKRACLNRYCDIKMGLCFPLSNFYLHTFKFIYPLWIVSGLIKSYYLQTGKVPYLIKHNKTHKLNW